MESTSPLLSSVFYVWISYCLMVSCLARQCFSCSVGPAGFYLIVKQESLRSSLQGNQNPALGGSKWPTKPYRPLWQVALCVCLWKWLSSCFSGSTPVASWLRHVAVGPRAHGELCPWCFIPGNAKHMPNASLRKILQTSPVVPQVNSQMQPIMYSNANQVVELQFGFSY